MEEIIGLKYSDKTKRKGEKGREIFVDTKNIIADTMFRLLKKNPFEDITVQLILDECKVSRSTFYRHFRDKYDLMNWCYLSYVDQVVLKYKKGSDWFPCLYLIYEFLNDNYKYFRNAFDVQGDNSFWKTLYDHIIYLYGSVIYMKKTNSKSLTAKERVFLEGYANSVCHCVKNWLNRENRESPLVMAKWMYELIPNIFQEYVSGDERVVK